MLLITIGALLLGCAGADDAQWINVKGGVKGGRQYAYNPYNNPGALDNKQHGGYEGYMMRFNMTRQDGSQGGGYGRQDFHEVGVCYIEVPTVTLVRDPAHVPAGNGSRPDLSRIRTCCKGYERNIEMFQVCDPVCDPECVNALCTAPNTCTCYPDHIRNLGGFCMPTCPIGCQNGHCSGGECLCKGGYTLDAEGKFCKPVCRENCGGIGNCTEPDTCTCKPGYQATPTGNCRSLCSEQCRNGDCVAPNECRCRPGYRKSQGQCEPECPQGCPNGRCISPNVCSNQPNPSSTTQPQGSIPPYYSPYQPNNRLYPSLDSLVLNGTQPGQAYPGQTYPGQTYPGQTYPGQTPGQRYPGQIYPGQTYPGQTYRGQTPGQRYPGQTYPGQTNPGQTYPGQINPGQQPSTENHNYPESHGLSGFGHTGQSGSYGQSGQSGYQTQTGYQGQTGTYGQSGQQGSTGQTDYYGQRPQYPGQPGSQTSYPGYPGGQQTSPANPGGIDACETPCINGVCVGVNTCRCNSGYVMDNTDPTGTRCIPNCPGGCPNGTCSAPNFCICNAGYRKDTSVKGRPACVKRIRRSVEKQTPEDIARLLIFDIPEY